MWGRGLPCEAHWRNWALAAMRRLQRTRGGDGSEDGPSPGAAQRMRHAADPGLDHGCVLGQLGEATTFAPWSAPRGGQAGGRSQACVEAINITFLATAFPHLVMWKA